VPAHPSTHKPTHALARAAALVVTTVFIAACGGGDEPPPAEQPLACLNLPAITWQRSATASADWNDIAIDSRNRLWLAGWAEGSVGTERIDPAGNSRAVVRQLDTDGRILWDSRHDLDTPGTDSAEAITLTPRGEVLIAGRTTGSLDGRPNAGQFDAFVAWGDAANPAAHWARLQTGTERPEHPRRVWATASGDAHVAGWDDEYVPSNFVQAWQDPIAFKFNRAPGAAPTLAWRHQGSSEAPDIGEGLAVDATGHTYLGGSAQSGAQRGMFLRKIAPDGRVLWTARYTAAGFDHVAAVHASSDGTLLIAGSVYGPFRGNAWQGEQDVFVARVSADDGRVLASWQYGSSNADWLTDMKVDAQGRIMLLGETLGSLVPGQANAGANDLFMLRIAPDGSVLGRAQWGTADDEMARRLAVDRCGNVAATGASNAATAGEVRRAGVLWFWRP
jgi:hypothetical protein